MSGPGEELARQIAKDHGLNFEDVRALAREAEVREEAEHAAGYLGDGKPPPADAYVLGRVDATLAEANHVLSESALFHVAGPAVAHLIRIESLTGHSFEKFNG